MARDAQCLTWAAHPGNSGVGPRAAGKGGGIDKAGAGGSAGRTISHLASGDVKVLLDPGGGGDP